MEPRRAGIPGEDGYGTETDAVEAFARAITDLMPLLEEIRQTGQMQRIRVNITVDLVDGSPTVFESTFNVWDRQGNTGEGGIYRGPRKDRT